MKNEKVCLIAATLIFLILFGVSISCAGGYDGYVQAMLGKMSLDEGDIKYEGESGTGDSILFEGGGSDIPYLGGAYQHILGENKLSYGVEGGFLGSWKTDKYQIAKTDGSASVYLKNSVIVLDFFLGGFTSLDIGKRLRIYLGAGPVLIFGNHEIDPSVPYIEGEDSRIELDEVKESKWDVGLYGRAGIDLRIVNNFIVGFCVRELNTNLEFNNPGGKTQMEGTQFLFTISATGK